MNIVVIDGQGGQVGAQLIKEICANFQNINLTAVGTNAVATSAMLKAGAHVGATGENPVVVACRKADVIIGPIGIIAANSLLGEITPKMAAAIACSEAKKILVPVSKCKIYVAGTPDLSFGDVCKAGADVFRQLFGIQDDLHAALRRQDDDIVCFLQ